jgi:hypothetical protein
MDVSSKSPTHSNRPAVPQFKSRGRNRPAPTHGAPKTIRLVPLRPSQGETNPKYRRNIPNLDAGFHFTGKKMVRFIETDSHPLHLNLRVEALLPRVLGGEF